MASFKNLVSTTSAQISSGGTITGSLVVEGDLQVDGGGSLSFDEIVQGTQVIDVTNTEALLVRKNGDGGDILTIDTTNSLVKLGKNGGTPSALNIYGATNGNPLLIYEDTDNSVVLNFYLDSSDNSGLALYANGASQKVNLGTTASSPTYFTGGNVGIGTSSPSSATGFNSSNLTIHGSDPSLVISDSGQDNLQICTHGNAFKFINDSDDRAFFIIEENAPANTLYLDNSGNVGIGNATPSSFESSASDLVVGSTTGDNGITIVSGTTSKGKIHFADGTSGDASYRGYIFYDHNSDAGMGFGVGASDVMKITSTGVNIGTTATYGNLTVGGTGEIIAGRASSGAGSFSMYEAGTTRFVIESLNGSNGVAFKTPSTARMILDDNSRISLSNNDNNTDNTVFGKSAFNASSNNGSDYNTVFGNLAMGTGTVNGALYNVAVGHQALTDITSGGSNVACGSQSGKALTTGNQNVMLGSQAMGNGIVTGDNNVAIGAGAGYNMTSGHSNIIIGKDTNPSANTGQNQTVIGFNTTGQADNSVVLGNASVTDVYMAQDKGAKVHMGDFHLQNPTSFTFNDNASHELCSFEARYTDSPTGTTGAHIAFRKSADDFTSGTETARIADIGVSGNINSGYGSSLQFHCIAGGTMTNLLTLGTSDSGNHVVVPQGKIRADKQTLNVTADFIGVQATYKKTDGASDNNDDLTALKAVVEFEDATTIGDVKGAYIASQLNTSASGESGSIYGIDVLAKQAQYGSIDTNNVFGINTFVDVDGNTVDGDVTGLYLKLDCSNPTGVQEAVYLDMNANADRFLRAFDSANSTARVLISSAGQIDAEGTINASQALDYAEYFESKDGKEIAVGTTVKLDGNKIVACSDEDTPLGVIRPKSGKQIVGGGQLFHWENKYMKDDYGADIWEDYTITKWIEEVTSEIYLKRGKDETGGVHGGSLRYYKEEPVLYNEDDTLPSGKQIGDVKTSVKYFCEHQYHSDYLPKDVSVPSNAETIEPNTQRQKLNPDFDISKTYKSREERTEWHIVGLLGQIPITKGQPVASNWMKMKDVSDKVEMYFVK